MFSPNCDTETSRTFLLLRINGPESGMFFALCWINHENTASSICLPESSCNLRLTPLFQFVWKSHLYSSFRCRMLYTAPFDILYFTDSSRCESPVPLAESLIKSIFLSSVRKWCVVIVSWFHIIMYINTAIYTLLSLST